MARQASRGGDARQSETSARRLARVNGEIRAVVADCLQRRLDDPRVGSVVPTRVRVSPDLRRARVFYTLIGLDRNQGEAQRGLERAAGLIQHEVATRLELRYTPALVFNFDDDLAEAERMDSLIRAPSRPEER